MEKIRYFYVVADYNDADYSKGIISVTEENYKRFKPLIEAIAKFEPYVCRHRMGSIDYSNWISSRPDLGQKSVYEKYPQFSEELIDDFNETFLCLPNPEDDYNEGFHTIVKIQEVFLGDIVLDEDHSTISKREPEKVKAFIEERRKLYSYTRKSDGKCINSIPFNEMTPEEADIIDQLNNLWKKYQ